MTVTVTLRERGSNAFLELRSLFMKCLQQSPLRPPGTDVKVGTESKGDGELPPSRWWSELTVIHTN